MMQKHIPDHVKAKLDKFERQVAHFTQQVSKVKDAITNARERLTGGFERDQDYNDMRALLDRLVDKDLPAAESKFEDAYFDLTQCRNFLAGLPDDAVLEKVTPPPSNGLDLHTVHRRIADAEDELQRLQAVPVLASDIERRIEQYVAAIARPKVNGIAAGQQLQVRWPNDVIAVLALLLPNEMTAALMKEVERTANDPMPVAERRKRIAELKGEIDTLQRQALALGDTGALPPEVVLQVRVVTKKVSRAA